MALPKMAVRVAMRHMVQMRPIERGRDRKPHYVRLYVKLDLPSRDAHLQKILSTAAQASGSLPFIRSMEPVEIVLDIPTTLDRRKAVLDALKSIPYVQSVTVGEGPPIR